MTSIHTQTDTFLSHIYQLSTSPSRELPSLDHDMLIAFALDVKGNLSLKANRSHYSAPAGQTAGTNGQHKPLLLCTQRKSFTLNLPTFLNHHPRQRKRLCRNSCGSHSRSEAIPTQGKESDGTSELEILVAVHPVAHRASGWSWWIQNLHTQMALLQHQLAGISMHKRWLRREEGPLESYTL